MITTLIYQLYSTILGELSEHADTLFYHQMEHIQQNVHI